MPQQANFGASPTAPFYNEFFDTRSRVTANPTGSSYFGAQGMAGGVMEWVQDWYDPDYYRTAPNGTPNLTESGERVLRGGAWEDNAPELRAFVRHHLPPVIGDVADLQYWGAGFRCARDYP